MEQHVIRGSILVVEDDPIVRSIITASLRTAGFLILEAATSREALARFVAEPTDLVLIDVRLPDGSGHDLAAQVREVGDPAVMFLTSLGGTQDRIRGLEMADDYLVKPVDLGELQARVRAVLRRWLRGHPGQSAIDVGGWTLDFVRRELANPAGAVIRLTRAEFDLVAALAQAGGITLSREYLLEVVGSADSSSVARSVDVLISRIRKKLAGGALADAVRTVPGQGYRWSVTC